MLGNNTNRQNAFFPRSASYDRGSASTGTAAHTGSNKAHMRTLKMIIDLVNALFSGSAANFRLRTGTQPLGNRSAELNQALRLGLRQCLCVCICYNEFNTAQAGIDHVIDRIAAAAANTENGDPGLKLGNVRLLQIDAHLSVPFCLYRVAAAVISFGFPRLIKNSLSATGRYAENAHPYLSSAMMNRPLQNALQYLLPADRSEDQPLQKKPDPLPLREDP